MASAATKTVVTVHFTQPELNVGVIVAESFTIHMYV